MIARRCKEERRAANLTQTELAQRAGLTRQTVSNLERSVLSPTLKTLEAIAKVFGLAASDLMGPPD